MGKQRGPNADLTLEGADHVDALISGEPIQQSPASCNGGVRERLSEFLSCYERDTNVLIVGLFGGSNDGTHRVLAQHARVARRL